MPQAQTLHRGCQAIEDAYALSLGIKRFSAELPKAFVTYQSLRQEKAMLVVNTSWRLGKMAHTKNPLLYFLFKKIFQKAPDSIFKNRKRKLMTHILKL
jgi:2-polyprenyl-6-methoxyphenol hydroxylase-like FAD-dependent oxidoreductase